MVHRLLFCHSDWHNDREGKFFLKVTKYKTVRLFTNYKELALALEGPDAGARRAKCSH